MQSEEDLSNIVEEKSLKFLMTDVVNARGVQEKPAVNEVEVSSRLHFLIIHLVVALWS